MKTSALLIIVAGVVVVIIIWIDSFFMDKDADQQKHVKYLLNSNSYLSPTHDREFLGRKGAPHHDLYNIRKVDTHVHHYACMNQKHILHFIKSKLRKEPDEVVIFRDGIYLTLEEVLESLQLTGYDLNVDLPDVHADKITFHRFDKFNYKYNPCGQSRVREIFLKQDNLIEGRFLAEVTKEVLSDLEVSKYQSTRSSYMRGNKVNGISWRVGPCSTHP